jgi:hypothetical protein
MRRLARPAIAIILTSVFTGTSARGRNADEAGIEGTWKLVIDQGRPLLFDLATDVGERSNVIGSHTDVATRLLAALEAWQADVDGEAKQRQPR